MSWPRRNALAASYSICLSLRLPARGPGVHDGARRRRLPQVSGPARADVSSAGGRRGGDAVSRALPPSTAGRGHVPGQHAFRRSVVSGRADNGQQPQRCERARTRQRVGAVSRAKQAGLLRGSSIWPSAENGTPADRRVLSLILFTCPHSSCYFNNHRSPDHLSLAPAAGSPVPAATSNVRPPRRELVCDALRQRDRPVFAGPVHARDSKVPLGHQRQRGVLPSLCSGGTRRRPRRHSAARWR